LMTKTTDDSGSGTVLEKETITYEPAKTETASYDSYESQQIYSITKGYILLQVESVGEAWYVNPVDGYRYYLKDGNEAYKMMRNFGLGISNTDLSKLQAGDYSLKTNLKGRIVLAVQENGEAYYIHPKDSSVHYMKNGDEAYRIMRYLSLGITNENLGKLEPKSEIQYLYNKDSGEASKAYAGSISLTAKSESGKVYLNWKPVGFVSESGFKIVVSETANPVYPGNDYHYLSSQSAVSDTWTGLTVGKTYHFRVCQYFGGTCGVYSNDVSVTVSGTVTANTGGSIKLTGYKNSEGKVILSWSLANMASDMGFKIVAADHANPVYPGDDYHYLSDPDIRTDTWSSLGSGVYHFRVCEYLGGKCGVYSNDLELSL